MQQQDERELIAQSLNGNHTAFAEIVDRYKNALYHHCFAIVHSEAAAEDIAQDTFIAAYYKLASYDSNYKLSTWLFKIATNMSLNWLKKTRREIVADDEMFAQVISDAPTPDRQFVYSELHRSVQRLRPKYKVVISLYYWQGFSCKEIAALLESPEGSVKGWLRRAKMELRKELL